MMFNTWVRGIFGAKTRPIVTRRRGPQPLRLVPLDERITPDVAPVVTGGTPNRTAIFGQATVIDPALVIDDPDGPNLDFATVRISGNFTAGDALLFTNQNNISGAYNTSNGTLTLTGSSSTANYQAALRSVQFQSTAAGAGPRSVAFSITPPGFFATNGHIYQRVVSSGIDWDVAFISSFVSRSFGRVGYLATLTSAAENAFAVSVANGLNVWIAGSDLDVEGEWRWRAGPEASEDGGNGRLFWRGGPANGSPAGGPVNGNYSNWRTGEPNDVAGEDEDYALLLASGLWNDEDRIGDNTGGYIVEYGGQGEAPLQLTSSTTVSLRTGSPSVVTPPGVVTVNAASITVSGSATALSLVRVYRDANNNGAVDGGEPVVAQQQLSGANTGYSISTPLTRNAVNNFVVTAQVANTAESDATNVLPIIEDSAPPMVSITAPTAGAATPNTTVTIEGTTEANAFVQIFRDANANGSIDPAEATPVATQQLTGGMTQFSRSVALTANAANSFLVTAKDATGNESAPAATPIITQDAIPPTLTLFSPAGPITVSTTAFNITGMTETNALVRVYRDDNNNGAIDGGEMVVATQQLAGGSATFSVATPLTSNAANNFVVQAVDAAGNLSPVRDVPTITQDSVPPNITLTSPTTATSTTGNSVTVTGSTEANALVRVYRDADNNGVVGPGETSPVAQQQLASGATAYSISVGLNPNAANNFLITATDAAGNESAPVDVPTVTQDTLPPAGPVVTTPTAPTTTRTLTATVAVTTEANAKLQVYRDLNGNNTIDGGDPVVATQQLTGGASSFSFTVGLNADTSNNFLVTATDAAGNVSVPADVPTITQDSIAPGLPTVTSPTLPTTTGNMTFTITGQAEANALVKVYRDANNNGAVDTGETVVAMQQLAGGSTTYGVSTMLTANAPNNFVVTATDAAGNESAAADVPTITQDAVAPTTPTVTAPAGPQTVNAATFTITGTAEANSLVRVYRDANNNGTIDPGETVVNLLQLSGGVTNYFVPVSLNQDAANNFVVTATDAAGNESPPVDVPTITEDSTPPGAPGVTFPASPTAVNADAITIAGAVEANALVRVYRDANNNNMLDAGELVVATQQLTGGASSYSLAAPLIPNAANNFLVTAVDAAGNESLPADVPTVTEDSVSPNTPSVTTPAAAVATRSATATVAGTTEANALVRLYRDANNNNVADPGELLVTQQLAMGATAYTILASLDANAVNNFLVTAVDAAGNESSAADVPTIVQDSIPPATPALTSPTERVTVNAVNMLLTGTAEANALVRVYRDANNNNTFDAGELVVATQQLADGATAFAVAAPLVADAGNNFLVTAADAAGNESLPADVPTITEDSTAPVNPVVTAPAAAATVRGTAFTVAGTAEPNAVVRVYRDANNNNAVDPGEAVLGQLQLTGGASTFTFEVPLNGNAVNNFLVTAADGVGNESAAADVPTITEDSTAPAGTTVTTPAALVTVNADTFAVAGKAEANALVQLYRDRNNNGVIDGEDVVVGKQQLADGATAYSLTVPLAQDAANNFLVTAADALGNESAPVDVFTVTEDSSPPLGPTVTAPAGTVTVAAGPFTIRGTAEANALVRVFLDANNDGTADDPTSPVASAQLTDGATKFAISTPLTANAANNFVVTATDGVGNSSAAATDVPTIFADVVGPTGTTPQSFALAGNAPLGTVVGTVQATAAGGPLTFVITDGDDAGIFAVDRATGRITVADAAGLRRSPRNVTLMVKASNAADPPLAKTFEVKISLTDPALPKGYAAGSEGGGGVAVLFNPDGTRRMTIEAFPGATGGVRVATADLNGDGVFDLIAATGPGAAGQVRVYDGATRALLFQSTPFEDAFTGGLFVEAADLNGDGRAELVISPDVGGGPRVVVFDVAARKQVASFYGIDDEAFRGGARVSLGDIDADGTPDLLVSAGVGGGPRVAAYDGAALMNGAVTRLFNDFFVFENTLRNGVYVAAGDLNGDGFADIIAGGGPGGAPRVFAVSSKDLLDTGTQIVLANFFAGDPAARTAVRVTTADLDGDTRADLIAGAGSTNGDRIVVYLGKDITPDGTPPASEAFNKIDSSITFGGGVFVG